MFLFMRSRLNLGGNRCGRLTQWAPLLIVITSSSTCLAEGSEQASVEQFNTTFLQGAPSSVDLQLLLAVNSVLPGNYRVDLYSNDTLVGRRDIDFRRNPSTARLILA